MCACVCICVHVCLHAWLPTGVHVETGGFFWVSPSIALLSSLFLLRQGLSWLARMTGQQVPKTSLSLPTHPTCAGVWDIHAAPSLYVVLRMSPWVAALASEWKHTSGILWQLAFSTSCISPDVLAGCCCSLRRSVLWCRGTKVCLSLSFPVRHLSNLHGWQF